VAYPHERPFAPVHDRLPYSPIVDREPIIWPGAARLAVWVVPNVEHYEYLPPPGAVDAYPRTPHPDVRKYAYHDYGNRVGFWRMVDVLDRHEVPCTVSLNVAVLDHYPEIAQAMVERGWAFMSHGLYNTRFLAGMEPDQERTFLETCNRVLARHTGRHFDGMLGPNITATARTPDLMAEAGMRYHADWVHDERPSPLLTATGARMVALPYTFELNDAPLLMRSHVEGDGYAQRCIAQFDRLYDEGGDGGRVMWIVVHPISTGCSTTSAVTTASGSQRHPTSSTITSTATTTATSQEAQPAVSLEPVWNVIDDAATGAARPGPDHHWFSWTPLPARPPLRWPGDARVAVSVVLDLGAVEWERPADDFAVRPLGGRGIAPFPDFPRMSHREFGHRVGVFRLLQVLHDLEMTAAAAVDVLTAEHYTPLLEHLRPAVGEVLAAGLSASRPISSSMAADEECHYIEATLARLERALGERPAGWLSPEHSESTRTPALLAEAGVRYVADWCNDEQPYAMSGAGDDLWAFPLSWELSDVSALHLREVSPIVYGRSMKHAFDVMCSEGESTGRVLGLHLHPWLSGQAFRAAAVADALEHIATSGQAWVATPIEIVEWCRQAS
jgi:peptidoglycan/xylan/chitin deacetylase (PgdA/CDA1 family)